MLEVELDGKYIREGYITYGGGRFKIGESDSDSEPEEIKRAKRLRATEEDHCEKRIKLGDKDVWKDGDVYKERIEIDERHSIIRKLVEGKWVREASISDNQPRL